MTTANLSDIKTEEDVRAFVDDFYAKVTVDPMLGPIFNDIAGVNWGEHMPTMYRFWSSMLLGTRSYKGVPFPPHAAIRDHITPAHFARWLALFTGSIDKLFKGEMAETAKQRAMNIAFIFQSKIAMMPRQAAAAAQSPAH